MGRFMRLSDLSGLSTKNLEKLKAEIDRAILEKRAVEVFAALNREKQNGRGLNRNMQEYVYILHKELKTGRLVFIEEALDVLEAHMDIES